MEECFVPPGWTRFPHNGRVVYSSPSSLHHPQVKIHSRAELSQYQRRGRFLDIDVDQFIFASKRKRKEKKYEVVKKNYPHAVVTTAPKTVRNGDETSSLKDSADYEEQLNCEEPHVQIQTALPSTEEITSGQRKKLENEQKKLSEAVSKLTIDTTRQVDHKFVLEKAALRLSNARTSQAATEVSVNLEAFKKLVKNSETVEEMTKLIWKNPFFQKRFSHLFSSKLLEQLMSLGSVSGNPLQSFPVDVNTNVYSEIMNFALDNAEDVILLLTALTKKHENPISAKDVIEIAYSFASLAEASCSQNNSLKKLKSLCLRTSGLTNAGLDSLANIGVAETSRSCRNDRDLLASISEEVRKQYAKKHVSQFCFDNLDIRINNTTHHLTLNYHEFEQDDTSSLCTSAKSRDEMLEFFSMDTINLQSDENKELFEQLQFVTTVALG